MILAKIGRISLSMLLVIGVWWASSGTIFSEMIVPKPWEVLKQLVDMIESKELFVHITASFRRISVGYVLGCTVGLVLGMVMGATRVSRDILTPPIEFFRNVPPVAMVPVVISFFGIGELGKYFLISYATTIVMILNTAAGVSATPRIRVRAAQCLGADKWSIFLRIVLPSAWPYILIGLRIALGFAFTGIVASEMLAAQEGIGFLIMQSTNILEPLDMFVGFILLGGFGLLTDQTLRAVIGKLARRHMVAIGR